MSCEEKNRKRSLYFECASGISGDMAVASLLDLGADQKVLEEVLATVPADGFKTEISRVKKTGVDCCDFNVILDQENHDHDMEYLYGHEHGEHHGHEHHGHAHHHEEHDHHHEEHSHDHENHHHEHEHHHEHHHHHEHRNLADVLKIIEGTKMTDNAKKIASSIFDMVAQAEAKAHGTTIDQVHFHEVGAVDSIVDIISFAVCFDNLNVDRVYVNAIYEGCGTIRCAHGILPVPVPAVAAIVEKAGLPLEMGKDKGEFVTPTGAAILAAVTTDFTLPEKFKILKTGYGAGKRTYERPNFLRSMLVEESSSNLSDTIVKLESNIDDCSGEQLAFVMEELISAGALDVHYVPCVMKKNRPAYILYVVCNESDRSNIEEIIFKHTTTIGIRRQEMERTKLNRRQITVETESGSAECKVVEVDGKERVYPEYKSISELCRKTGKAYSEIQEEILRASEKIIQK